MQRTLVWRSYRGTVLWVKRGSCCELGRVCILISNLTRRLSSSLTNVDLEYA